MSTLTATPLSPCMLTEIFPIGCSFDLAKGRSSTKPAPTRSLLCSDRCPAHWLQRQPCSLPRWTLIQMSTPLTDLTLFPSSCPLDKMYSCKSCNSCKIRLKFIIMLKNLSSEEKTVTSEEQSHLKSHFYFI